MSSSSETYKVRNERETDMTNVIKVDFNNQTQVVCDYNTQLDNQVLDEIKQNITIYHSDGETEAELDNCRRALVHTNSENERSFNQFTKDFAIFYTDLDINQCFRVATLDDLLNFYLLNKENVVEEIINQNKTA